jgi:hypothetical protein
MARSTDMGIILMLRVLDHIYVVSPLRPSSTTTADSERLAAK